MLALFGNWYKEEGEIEEKAHFCSFILGHGGPFQVSTVPFLCMEFIYDHMMEPT